MVIIHPFYFFFFSNLIPFNFFLYLRCKLSAEILDDQVERPLSQPSSRSNSQIDTPQEPPQNPTNQQTSSFINDSNVEDIKHFVKQVECFF